MLNRDLAYSVIVARFAANKLAALDGKIAQRVLTKT